MKEGHDMNKKLKGFTLVELIVVIALFAMIMFGAMSLLGPVSNQFRSTVKYENVRANLDNTRLYIEGKLRYADRVWIYTGYDSLPPDATTEFSNYYWFNGYTQKDGSGNTIATYNRSAVNSAISNTKIYVMGIYNSTASGKELGQISLSTYDSLGGSGSTKDYAVNKAFYDKYGFKVLFGNRKQVFEADGTTPVKDSEGNDVYEYDNLSLGNFMVTVEAYDKKTSGSTVSYKKTNFTSTATFGLMNVYDGGIKNDTFYCEILPGGNHATPKLIYNYNEIGGGLKTSYTEYPEITFALPSFKVPKYRSFDGGSSTSENIFIVFTLPDKIEETTTP